MAMPSRGKQFFLLSIPFGALIAIPRLGHLPIPYVIAIWIVSGSLFGGFIVLLDSLPPRSLTRRPATLGIFGRRRCRLSLQSDRRRWKT